MGVKLYLLILIQVELGIHWCICLTLQSFLSDTTDTKTLSAGSVMVNV